MIGYGIIFIQRFYFLIFFIVSTYVYAFNVGDSKKYDKIEFQHFSKPDFHLTDNYLQKTTAYQEVTEYIKKDKSFFFK